MTAKALVACLWTSTALANDISELPEPTIYVDVRGFKIGMTAEEALANLKSEYAAANPQIGKVRDPNTGREWTSTIVIHPNLQDKTELHLQFTGPYSDNRLFYVRTGAQFAEGQRPSVAKTRDSLVSKYGLPTNAFGTTFFYNFDPEIVSMGSDEEISAMIKRDPWDVDFASIARANGWDVTRQMAHLECPEYLKKVIRLEAFWPPRSLQFAELPWEIGPECHGSLKTALGVWDGDLLGSLAVEFADFNFAVEAAKIDEAGRVEDQLPGEQPTGDTPKL